MPPTPSSPSDDEFPQTVLCRFVYANGATETHPFYSVQSASWYAVGESDLLYWEVLTQGTNA